MFGMALTTLSLTMQLTGGMDVFAHVCGQKANTLSNYCYNYSAIWWDVSIFVKFNTISRLFSLEITTNSKF